MSKSDDNSSFMEIKKTMLPMPMKLSEQNNKSLAACLDHIDRYAHCAVGSEAMTMANQNE